MGRIERAFALTRGRFKDVSVYHGALTSDGPLRWVHESTCGRYLLLIRDQPEIQDRVAHSLVSGTFQSGTPIHTLYRSYQMFSFGARPYSEQLVAVFDLDEAREVQWYLDDNLRLHLTPPLMRLT